jgi:hypothetical protein
MASTVTEERSGYRHSQTTFDSPKLTGPISASTSEVWTSAILETSKNGIKHYDVEITFNGMTFVLKLKNLPTA